VRLASTVAAAENVSLSRAQEDRWREMLAAWPLPIAELSVTYAIDGPLDVTAFRDALRSVVADHEQLRLRIAPRGEGYVATVRPPDVAVPVPLIDLSRSDSDAQRSLRDVYAAREAAVPIDLERSLPVRAMLLRLAPARFELLLTLSHIVADGWCLGILVGELRTRYLAVDRGPGERPPASAPYRRFVEEDEARYDSGAHQRHVTWWRQHLEDAAPRLDLGEAPADALTGAESLSQRFELSSQLGEAVRAGTRSLRSTHMMIGLAVLAVQLLKRSRERVFVIVVPFVGPRFPRYAGTIGLFANRLTVRLDLTAAESFVDVVRGVRQAVLDAIDHADTPGRLVTDDLRRQGRELCPQVGFQVFPDDLVERDRPDGLSIRLTEFRSAAGSFDLQLVLAEPGDNGITGWLIHRTSVLSPHGGSLWIDEYGALLKQALEDPYGLMIERTGGDMRPNSLVTAMQADGRTMGVLGEARDRRGDGSCGSNTGHLSAEELLPFLSSPEADAMNFLNEIALRFPDAISFAAGRPYDGFFSSELVRRYRDTYIAHLMRESGGDELHVRRTLLQYGRTKGIIHELVAKALFIDEGIDVDPESIVVTVGAQEAIYLILRALRRTADDVVLHVHPGYVGLTGAAHLADIRVLPVRSAPDGVSLTDLRDVIGKSRDAELNPRALYVNTDFANPTGRSLSRAVRDQLLRVAEDEQILLIEDNPYGIFAGDQGTLPTLKALDRSRRVVLRGILRQVGVPGCAGWLRRRGSAGRRGRSHGASGRPARQAEERADRQYLTARTGGDRRKAVGERAQHACRQQARDRCLPAEHAASPRRACRPLSLRRPAKGHLERPRRWLLPAAERAVRSRG
jgi:Condensation domain/Aminotransferase class I and II